MNKKMLALLIGANLALYGCDDTKISGEPTVDPAIERSLQAETKIAFDLTSEEKTVVTPSFLAMDSFDGTLAADGTHADTSSYVTDTMYNPTAAIGKNDGWGTLEPITIAFEGKTLQAETAQDGFILIKSFDPTSKTDTTTPAALTYGIDYVATTVGSQLVISLLKPLDPSANYMFAVTDGLKDSDGNAVGMSNSYAMLKSTTKPPSTALDPVQKIAHATEAAISAATGVNKDSIIFSTWFTTASVGNALYAAKAAIALSANAVSTTGNAAAVWGDNVDTTGMFGFSPANTADNDFANSPFNTGGVSKYKGIVKLPYFLEANTDPTKFLATPWSSATPSLAKIINTLKKQDATSEILMAQLLGPDIGITQQELATLTNEPDNKAAQLAVIQKLINKELYLDSEKTQRLDTERLITKYSPVPQLRAVSDVPYNLYMPSPAAGCADAANIPVNIFTHGFGRENDDADYYAMQTLGTNCQALIAIDLPLHGERWKLGDAINQTLSYMNLTSLPVARDNIRQSVTDLMSLRASLGLMFGAKAQFGQPAIEPTYGELSKLSLVNGPAASPTVGVGYVGVSLGGIVGIDYTATVEQPVIFKEDGSVDTDKESLMFKPSRAHFDVPGGGIAYFLLNSERFGGTIQTALKATDGYTAFKQASCAGLSDTACDALFFNQFAYAAQSVLDTIDPANLIGKIQAPVYLSMAQGDKVIPNGPFSETLVKSAVAGTLPMILSNEFTQVSGPVDNVTKHAGLYKQANSFHGALITPPIGDYAGYAAPIAKMQEDSISFLSNGSLPVSEPNYLYQIN